MTVYRGMSSEVLTEIAKGNIHVWHLVDVGFSTPLYLTDAGQTITWDSNDYVDSAGLMSLDDIEEEFDFAVNQFQFTLSGTELANFSIALSENFTGVKVTVYRAMVASGVVVASPFIVFEGEIDSWNAVDDPSSNSSALTWTCSNHWVNFTRTAGRRTNDGDQQLFYPGDTGLEYAGQTDPNMKWPA